MNRTTGTLPLRIHKIKRQARDGDQENEWNTIIFICECLRAAFQKGHQVGTIPTSQTVVVSVTSKRIH